MTKQRSNPDLEDIIDGALEQLMYNFNCHKVGIINSFDPTTQKASIQLVDKASVQNQDGEQLRQYSLLKDCPVFIAKGSQGGLTYSINSGDSCLVLFNDRDIDNWDGTGAIQKPNSLRTHSLSDGIAVVGIRSQINAITDYNNSATELNYQNTKISLSDKVGVSNSSQDLKTLIDSLIDIISSLMVVDPISGNLPIDTTTATSLTQIKTDFNNLLKTNT